MSEPFIPFPGLAPFAKRLARLLAPISRAALWVSAFGLVLMTVFVFWQVIGRKILNDTPSWTEPAALLLMSWFILLGAAVGVRENDHLGFEVGLHYASPRWRMVLQTVTHLLVIAFGLCMVVYGGQLTLSTWGAKMAGIAIPQGMDYLPIAGGGVLIALFAFEKLVQLFAGVSMEAKAPHAPFESVE